MTYDLLIRNARIVDGSGEPSFQADASHSPSGDQLTRLSSLGKLVVRARRAGGLPWGFEESIDQPRIVRSAEPDASTIPSRDQDTDVTSLA